MSLPPPWSRTLPEGPWDAIVVGSGMGGLATAAALSLVGWRVLVLERHLRPGGFTQTFRRGAARWDVGVHVVGEMGASALPGALLDRLSEGRLRWSSIGNVVDRVLLEDGSSVELPIGEAAIAEAIEAHAPGSARATRRYLDGCRAVSGALGQWLIARSLPEAERAFGAAGALPTAMRAIHTTARTAVDTMLPGPVQPIMGLRWGYLGTLPDQLSFAGLASATAHFVDGGYYPVGGAGEIAVALARTVQRAGGALVVGCGVRTLRTHGCGVAGVVTEGGAAVDAPVVVSAIGARQTVDALVPAEASSGGTVAAWVEAVRALPLSMSHVAMYLALDEDPRVHGMDGANVWGVDPGTRDVGWYASFPSIRDPEWRGPHLASIIRLVPFEPHREHARGGLPRPAAYSAYKAALSEDLLARVSGALPWLARAAAHVEVATPATVVRYVDAPEGATYGLAATPERLLSPALSARTPIPGLYLSGSDVVLPGVVGALVGGLCAAAAAGGPPAMRILLDAARLSGGARSVGGRLRAPTG